MWCNHSFIYCLITGDFNNEETNKYGFTNIDEVVIKAGTSPSSNFEKSDGGTASKNDGIYGISVIHNKTINNVHIRYSYFGIPFNNTVKFKQTGCYFLMNRFNDLP